MSKRWFGFTLSPGQTNYLMDVARKAGANESVLSTLARLRDVQLLISMETGQITHAEVGIWPKEKDGG